VLDFGLIHIGGLVTGGSIMSKQQGNFLEAFFDCAFVDEEKKTLPDLPAKKQDKLRFNDNFTLFKVEDQCKVTI
jgi:hypothetical protein